MGKIIILLLALVVSAGAMAQTVEERIAAIVQDVSRMIVIEGEDLPKVALTTRMEQLGVPGVSIAVFNDGAIEWARAYGFADVEERISATPETFFQAASISKAVTAMAALRFAQDGTLDLDENVNDGLLSWELPDNEHTASIGVTPRSLLNHTGGTTVYGFPGYVREEPAPSTVDVLDGHGNTEAVRVQSEPGSSFGYSGGGYTILQLLLSDIGRRPFPELMRDTVLEPLGMNSSTFEQPLPGGMHALAASGYDSSGDKIHGSWRVYPEMAAAGLWTTPSDLARFSLEVQQSGTTGGTVLSRELARAMLQPGMESHGLGLSISDDLRRFEHSGSNAGFRAALSAYIDDGDGAVIMTNSDNGSALIPELLITIAREYEWPGFEPIRKSVVSLERSAYEALVGQYRVTAPPIGVDVSYEDGQLIARGAFGVFHLLPESENLFFIRENAAPFEFISENGEVVALTAQGLRAERID